MLRQPLLACALLALPLAGCLGPAPTATPTAGLPAAALPRPELLDPVFLAPIDLGIVELGAEPSVGVGVDGTVYVTTPLALWRSDDGGRSYEALGAPSCPSGLPACPGLETHQPGMKGGGDAAIAVTRDGRVHWLGLFAPDAPIPYQVSEDRGATWSKPLDLASGNSTDREWIVVNATGALFAQWRDFGNTSECAAPGPVPLPTDPGCAPPTGVLLRRSLDGGATWEPAVRATDDNRQGPVAPDPSSAWMYLPVFDGPNGTIDVARSADGGATWEDVHATPVPQRPFIFPIAAVDEAGTVYVAYSSGEPGPTGTGEPVDRNLAIPSVFLITSADHGATWSAPRLLSTEGVPAVMPWIAAGAPGRVAVAWYEAAQPWPSGRLPNLWRVVAAMSATADRGDGQFKAALVTPEPIHVGGLCADGGACALSGGDRSMLDFFELRLLPDGSPVLAFAGDADVPRATVKVFASVMTDGTRLR
ncbi:MAG TPA: sialidase family protein [Candidatus Thermoplasmatota archaeon]|jgi:hypothetical protein|nr:sialidase family protein [Candidatus Thermoplasmatota archaeon]